MLSDHKYTNNVIEKKIDGIFNFEKEEEKKGEREKRTIFY